MPNEAPTTEICLEILRAVGTYALDEQRNAKGPAPLRHDRFNALAGNAITDVELTRLKPGGIAGMGHRCIALPVKQAGGKSWAPLLWVAETSKGDHRLQVVIAGDGRPFGYRWEPPEGPRAPQHDYWHAQPITSVRIGSVGSQTDVAFGSGDISNVLPTFPIDAPDRLSLLDALLVSIYGPGYLETFVTDARLRASVQKSTLKRSWSRIRIGASASAATIGVKKRLPKGIKKKSK